MRCSRCRREAVFYQPYSGLHLCEAHFRDDVEAKARKEIRAAGGIRRGDRIAVALSGSPESIALAHFLYRTFAGHRDQSLLAITADEGIGGYSRLPAAEQAARSLGMEWLPVSPGMAAGTIPGETERDPAAEEDCARCRARKREALEGAACRAGATVLAFGDTLDGLARQVFVQVLRGEVPAGARRIVSSRTGLRSITPFRRIPDEEIRRYGQAIGLTAEDPGCPRAGHGVEGIAGDLLSAHARGHPSAPHALVRLWDSLLETGDGPGPRHRNLPGREGGD
jgi:tRNA(Ile)-lysidine synthase TilS/MesJ